MITDKDRAGQAAEAVRDILQHLGNTVSALKIYPPDNPTVRDFVESLVVKLQAFLEKYEKLEVRVEEFNFVWQGQVVYSDTMPIKSLPLFFFKDGLYTLFIYQGLSRDEIIDFLDLIRRESHKPPEESDIVTALWEKDFPNIHYYAPDYYLENRILDEVKKTESKFQAGLSYEAYGERIKIAVDPAKLAGGKLELTAEDRAMVESALVSGGSGPPATAGTAPAPGGSAGTQDKSPAASMDPTLTERELEAVEKLIRSNRRLVPEEEFIDLMTELIYLEENADHVRATLDALLEFNFHQLERGNFFVAISIIKKLKELLDHLVAIRSEKAGPVEAFLKIIASPRIVDAVRARIEKREKVDWEALVEFFKLLGSAVVPFSADIFELVDDPEVRKRLFDFVLRETAGEPGFLASLADDARPSFSKLVIGVLERQEGQKGIGHLAVFVRSRNRELKLEAVEALGRAGGETGNRILLGFLNDPLEEVRIQAALKVSPVKERARILKIIEEASSREFRGKSLKEKRAILGFLGRTMTGEALEFLKKTLLKRRLWPRLDVLEMQLAAAHGLEQMATPEAREVLRRGSRTGPGVVREECRAALERLKAAENRKAEGRG
jgi:hypothetical protein